MKKFLLLAKDYIKRSDLVLFFLCVAATLFGIVLISSATNHMGTGSYVKIQVLALFLGIILFAVFSIIDVEIFADKAKLLFVFGVLFICSLEVFGVAGDTGNKAWIRFGPIGIQPAEIVKITFIISLAKQIVSSRDRRRGINAIPSIFMLLMHFFILFGLIVVISGDLGSALVYLFIFVVMLFAGGLKAYWFLIGGGAVLALWPIAWNHLLSDYQKDRILAPYDPTIDPTGLGITWQANISKTALGSGQFLGQGLYNGAQTKVGANPQQHTDFIFSVAGEELGFVGCIAIIVILMLIIIRCLYVGIKSNSQLGMLVCFGIAAMLIFQTFENIGMCTGITPVIGLTLPFFSYGGSSIVTLFAAMGIVSGIKMRPKPSTFARRFY